MHSPTTYDLAGITLAVMQQRLADALDAKHALATGAKGEAFSYSQGDGTKTVTYTRANIAQLDSYIAALSSEIRRRQGLGGRRPLRFRVM